MPTPMPHRCCGIRPVPERPVQARARGREGATGAWARVGSWRIDLGTDAAWDGRDDDAGD